MSLLLSLALLTGLYAPFLREGCSIERRPRASEFHRSDAWLACGSTSFLLAHPDNLVGYVAIKTRADALAFVELFSSMSTHCLFPLVDLAEVGSGRGSFFVTDEAKFAQYRRATEIKEFGVAGGSKAFSVVRVAIHQFQLTLVTETVSETGWYHLLETKPLVGTLADAGIQFFGCY